MLNSTVFNRNDTQQSKQVDKISYTYKITPFALNQCDELTSALTGQIIKNVKGFIYPLKFSTIDKTKGMLELQNHVRNQFPFFRQIVQTNLTTNNIYIIQKALNEKQFSLCEYFARKKQIPDEETLILAHQLTQAFIGKQKSSSLQQFPILSFQHLSFDTQTKELSISVLSCFQFTHELQEEQILRQNRIQSRIQDIFTMFFPQFSKNERGKLKPVNYHFMCIFTVGMFLCRLISENDLRSVMDIQFDNYQYSPLEEIYEKVKEFWHQLFENKQAQFSSLFPILKATNSQSQGLDGSFNNRISIGNKEPPYISKIRNIIDFCINPKILGILPFGPDDQMPELTNLLEEFKIDQQNQSKYYSTSKNPFSKESKNFTNSFLLAEQKPEIQKVFDINDYDKQKQNIDTLLYQYYS